MKLCIRIATWCFRSLASTGLFVVLLTALAVAIAGGTIVEAYRGSEYAQWYVYGSRPFLALLTLLGVTSLSALVARFPWQKRQAGSVIGHTGLLVLLAGSLQTLVAGVEGEVSLREGQQTDRLLVPARTVISVSRPAEQGSATTEFSFQPGPADWPDRKQLNFGVADGLGLKVLKFYRHAQGKTEWVADRANADGPALRLRLTGPSGNLIAEDWLAGNRFGGEVIIGPTRLTLLPVPAESMLADFLEPPTEDVGRAGVLSIHYAGQRKRVRVTDDLPQRIAVGEAGLTVEIVAYLPNARPTPKGDFVSQGDRPENPLLELRVHRPGHEPAERQVAFAKLPLLNLDGVRGTALPVTFWYHHAGVTPTLGAAFLQTPAGKLYCRAVVPGAYQHAHEVHPGDRIALGDQFRVTLQQHLPFARQAVQFEPVARECGGGVAPEAAALVEVSVGDQRRQVWLQRQDEQFGAQQFATVQGPVVVSWGHDRQPLGFMLRLERIARPANTGEADAAARTSTVRLAEAADASGSEGLVSTGQPLTYGRFRLHQAGFEQLPGHKEISRLTVTYDPGRLLKYIGSVTLLAGGLLWLVTHGWHRHGGERDDADRRQPTTDGIFDERRLPPHAA